MSQQRTEARERRRRRVRANLAGTPSRPRLNVFRSLTGTYAQLIDDTIGHTVAAASSLDAEIKNADYKKTEAAYAIGKLIAKRAQEKNIKQVVFDRAGYRYHGRVKAVADGAREGGLEF